MSPARRIRTYREVADPAAEDIVGQVAGQARRLADRLASVDRLVAVASGKGGVGKSLVAANLAAGLATRGRRVGVVDGDLNGPTQARMLAARGPLVADEGGIEPATGAGGVRVMSMDLLVDGEVPVEWREPEVGRFVHQSALETGALREFLADVAWGRLDALVVDVAPGTDKLSRLLELVPALDLLLLVSIPSDAARRAVARAARLARRAGAGEVGLVANMAGSACPACGARSPMFEPDAVQRLAADEGLELWAEVPFEPGLSATADAGRPPVLEPEPGPAGRALLDLAARVDAVPIAGAGA